MMKLGVPPVEVGGGGDVGVGAGVTGVAVGVGRGPGVGVAAGAGMVTNQPTTVPVNPADSVCPLNVTVFAGNLVKVAGVAALVM